MVLSAVDNASIVAVNKALARLAARRNQRPSARSWPAIFRKWRMVGGSGFLP
jgi:hypothetical protein